MSKFKIGDKVVRIERPLLFMPINSIHTISKVNSNDSVKLKGKGDSNFYAEYFKLYYEDTPNRFTKDE